MSLAASPIYENVGRRAPPDLAKSVDEGGKVVAAAKARRVILKLPAPVMLEYDGSQQSIRWSSRVVSTTLLLVSPFSSTYPYAIAANLVVFSLPQPAQTNGSGGRDVASVAAAGSTFRRFPGAGAVEEEGATFMLLEPSAPCETVVGRTVVRPSPEVSEGSTPSAAADAAAGAAATENVVSPSGNGNVRRGMPDEATVCPSNTDHPPADNTSAVVSAAAPSGKIASSGKIATETATAAVALTVDSHRSLLAEQKRLAPSSAPKLAASGGLVAKDVSCVPTDSSWWCSGMVWPRAGLVSEGKT